MKKLPPWAWIAAAIGIGAALYLYKKSKEAARLAEEKASENPSEAPVTAGVEPEEYPYSIAGLSGSGAGGGGGALGNALESQSELHELFGQQSEFDKTLSTQDQEFAKQLSEMIARNEQSVRTQTELLQHGSGGGAPSQETGGQTNVQPPPTAAPSCPPAFPNHNPADGPVGPKSCYKYSRDRCSEKSMPYKHVYEDGHYRCSPT